MTIFTPFIWLIALFGFLAMHHSGGNSSVAVGREVRPQPVLVSSFTTFFPCCQPRVTNIRRAAQLLDRKVIPAHARFSMNAALGRRTRARGFVPAPQISGGRLVDSVGGGISQV